MNKNYIYGAITVIIWSTLAPIAKHLLAEIPDLEALCVSSVFAFLFLLFANLYSGSFSRIRDFRFRDLLTMSGLGFLGLFLYSALYYRGLSILTSQEACILNYLWPMMLVVFSSLILKEPMNWMKATAMICSFLGIMILSSGGAASQGGNRAEGILCCIVAAACYGLFSVLNKKFDYDQNITMMVIWFTVAICSGVTGFLTESWVPITGMQWIGLLWLGVVVNAIAYLLWALALNGARNTAAIANLAYLVPFLSLILSAVFLKEKITIRAVIAIVFIIGGIFAQSLYEQRHSKAR